VKRKPRPAKNGGLVMTTFKNTKEIEITDISEHIKIPAQ